MPINVMVIPENVLGGCHGETGPLLHWGNVKGLAKWQALWPQGETVSVPVIHQPSQSWFPPSVYR